MVFPQVETIPPRYDKAKFNNQIVPVINDYLLRKFTKSESFIVEPNEERFEAQSGESGKVSYGGSSDAGSVDGSDANAVLQAALNAGISINVKLGTYPITHLDVNSAKLFSTENAILAPTTNETDPAIKTRRNSPRALGVYYRWNKRRSN